MHLTQLVLDRLAWAKRELLQIDKIEGPQAKCRGTIEFGFAATRLGNEFLPQ